jgi:hypothetical protein
MVHGHRRPWAVAVLTVPIGLCRRACCPLHSTSFLLSRPRSQQQLPQQKQQRRRAIGTAAELRHRSAFTAPARLPPLHHNSAFTAAARHHRAGNGREPFFFPRGPPWPELAVHAAGSLRSLSFLLLARIGSASTSRCSRASPWPETAWPSHDSAAARHGRRRAHSGGPPGQSVAPLDAAQRAEHAGAHRATGGLAADEIKSAELLPCLGAADGWGRLDCGSLPSAPVGALHRVHLAFLGFGF